MVTNKRIVLISNQSGQEHLREGITAIRCVLELDSFHSHVYGVNGEDGTYSENEKLTFSFKVKTVKDTDIANLQEGVTIDQALRDNSIPFQLKSNYDTMETYVEDFEEAEIKDDFLEATDLKLAIEAIKAEAFKKCATIFNLYGFSSWRIINK